MRHAWRLVRYIRPYALQLLASVVLLAGVGLFSAFRLLLVRPIFDRVLNPASQSRDILLFKVPWSQHALYLQQLVPEHFHNAWTVVAFALVASTLLKGLFDYAGTYLVNYAGFGLITDLRDELYNAILRRSVAFFHRFSTGTLLSTLINDIERVQVAMSAVLAEFLQQFFTLLFTVAAVIVLGGRLAWFLLLFVPFIVFSVGRIGRRVRHTTRRGQDKLAEIHNILHETITGNRIVKAFGMELWEAVRFRGAARRLFRANLRSVRAAALSSPLMDFFAMVGIALMLLMGRDRIKTGEFTLGAFAAFIVAVFSLYDPVRKMAQFYNNFQQAIGASSMIFSFMDADDDVKERSKPVQLPKFHQGIRFEHVSFGYDDGNGASRPVLQDVDLEVKAGEVVAIVGSSGAGKTTMVHLIPRFFDVTGGRLTIDGRDVRELSLASLRAQIGIVTQDTILFNDTVRNNIAYGQPNVSLPVVKIAAEAALADGFIGELPEGYDTIIGERGVRLSGGERQRIAIARALLKNAPILILDEATSALDTESESLVASALQNLMAGRTTVVIAHRLSTVRRADRIIVLENGAISDIGSHEDLMARLGTYRRLYDLQFVDLEPPKVAAESAGEK
ncbi:MAG: ABC transporter ATP-binding protein/permease [Acidobacteriia bacterium]|nr:ABC transporter ATP-binding protein/permease [Terriglobia bacterium]